MSNPRVTPNHVPSSPVRSAHGRLKSRFTWMWGVFAVLACGAWVQERSLMDSAPNQGAVSALEVQAMPKELNRLGDHFNVGERLRFGPSFLRGQLDRILQSRSM